MKPRFKKGPRCEHLQFTPCGKFLLILDFKNNCIYANEVNNGDVVNSYVIYSQQLKAPHSLCFVNEKDFFVANRWGNIELFTLPLFTSNVYLYKIQSKLTLTDELIDAPTCIIAKEEPTCFILFIGNVFKHAISRFKVSKQNYQIISKNTSVAEGGELMFPDSLLLSPCKDYFFVASHGTGECLMYSAEKFNQKDPLARFTDILFPHDVRIDKEGKLFVTDAGSPYVFVFEKTSDQWFGTYRPHKFFRGVDVGNFVQENCEEGGIKGIDFLGDWVALTSEHQPLKLIHKNEIEFSDPLIIRDQLLELSKGLKENPKFSHSKKNILI